MKLSLSADIIIVHMEYPKEYDSLKNQQQQRQQKKNKNKNKNRNKKKEEKEKEEEEEKRRRKKSGKGKDRRGEERNLRNLIYEASITLISNQTLQKIENHRLIFLMNMNTKSSTKY